MSAFETLFSNITSALLKQNVVTSEEVEKNINSARDAFKQLLLNSNKKAISVTKAKTVALVIAIALRNNTSSDVVFSEKLDKLKISFQQDNQSLKEAWFEICFKDVTKVKNLINQIVGYLTKSVEEIHDDVFERLDQAVSDGIAINTADELDVIDQYTSIFTEKTFEQYGINPQGRLAKLYHSFLKMAKQHPSF